MIAEHAYTGDGGPCQKPLCMKLPSNHKVFYSIGEGVVTALARHSHDLGLEAAKASHNAEEWARQAEWFSRRAAKLSRTTVWLAAVATTCAGLSLAARIADAWMGYL